VEHEYVRYCAQYGAQFITNSECDACWTRNLLSLHIASPANHHLEFGFGQRLGDVSWVIGGMPTHICTFQVIYLQKVICVLVLLQVRIFLIPVPKLWDMRIRLCMCKGQTHHVKVLDSKSGCKATNKFNFCLPIAVKWESKRYISDEIYKQSSSDWCHTSHSKSVQCWI